MSQLKAEPIRKPRNESTVSQKFTVSIVLATLLISALCLQQVWWTFFLVAELFLVVGCGELLAMNLPTRIRRQIKLNAHRIDGSKSRRRSDIEKHSVRRFKHSVMACFALSLVPINVCFFVYCFFLPQLVRLKETVVFSPRNEWMAVFLEPAIQIIILLSILVAISFDSLKSIFLRLLKDLDDEVSLRAEEYSVYDLVHPPTHGHEISDESQKAVNVSST